MKSSSNTKNGAIKRKPEELGVDAPPLKKSRLWQGPGVKGADEQSSSAPSSDLSSVTILKQISSPPVKQSRLWHFRGVFTPPPEVKTAALCSDSPFVGVDQQTLLEVEDVLETSFSQSQSDRPVAEIKETSEEGIPVSVLTPGKTELNLKHNLGAVCVYSNEPSSPARRLDLPTLLQVHEEQKHKIENSVPYQQIKPNSVLVKTQEMTVTLEQLDQVGKEIKANKGRRKTSQVKVMNGSATQYGRQYNIPAEKAFEKIFEWLHLIMHRLLGEAGQKEINLICGKKSANSNMMFVEFQHKKLARAYPEGYKLQAFAETVDNVNGSQMGTIIGYTITTKDFRLRFQFNAQTKNRPYKCNVDYVEGLVLAALKLKNKSKRAPLSNQTNSPAAAPVVPKQNGRIYLFTRRKLDMEAAADDNTATNSASAIPQA